MKKITLILILTLATVFSYSQKKFPVKDSTPKQKDTTVLIVCTVKDFNSFMNYIDGLNLPHQDVKSMQKFIYDRIKIMR